MSGQIPKYGEHFRRESIPYQWGWKSTQYVSKRYPDWKLRSNGNSEQWYILHLTRNIAGPFATMTEAGNRLIHAMWELYADDNEPPPRNLYGHRNKN